MALLLATVGLLACAGGQQTVPSELRGTWITDHPDYRHGTMQITLDRVVFDTGEGEPKSNTVVKVHEQPEENFVAYAIEYLSAEGAEYTLHLHFYRGAGELRLKNRDEAVWRRQQDA